MLSKVGFIQRAYPRSNAPANKATTPDNRTTTPFTQQLDTFTFKGAGMAEEAPNNTPKKTVDEAMKEMNNYRRKTALKVDRLIILSDGAVSNIALELELFTNKTVMYI
jgi:hypothetical protein